MTIYPRSLTTPSVDALTKVLFYQLMSVMGIKQLNIVTRCLYPFFFLPTRKMASLMVTLDRSIADLGWNAAVEQFQGNFVRELQVLGAENIPQDGPLLVVANHPAAYDVVVLINAVHRNDLKVLHSDIAFMQMLPNVAEHGIPVPYNIPRRLQTIKDTIQHLNLGGSILLFPRGNVEPDPAVSPGAVASLDGWSPSIELFLRKAQQTKTIVAIASGMLSESWFQSPLIRMWKKPEQRQKVAEIFQIAAQFIIRKKPANLPKVTFSEPLSMEELCASGSPSGSILNGITSQARQMLAVFPHK